MVERVNGQGFLANTNNIAFDSLCYATSPPGINSPNWTPFTKAPSGDMAALGLVDIGSGSFASPSPFTTSDNSFQVADGSTPSAPYNEALATPC
jgi:hypothetical protein